MVPRLIDSLIDSLLPDYWKPQPMRIRRLPANVGQLPFTVGGVTVRTSFPVPASVVLRLVSLLSVLSASACDLGTDPAEPRVRSIQVTPGTDTLDAL